MASAGHKPARGATAALTLAVQYGVRRAGLPSRQRIVSWARAALLTDTQVTFRIVGRKEGRALNRDFRGRDYATNVLTFTYPGIEPLCGDIVLCAPVIAQEAREQCRLLEAHFAHLVVHGMLHLQGYDHQNTRAARAMEMLETEIIAQLGYADPYRPVNGESL
jgi:probable rRNA maturation factor